MKDSNSPKKSLMDLLREADAHFDPTESNIQAISTAIGSRLADKRLDIGVQDASLSLAIGALATSNAGVQSVDDYNLHITIEDRLRATESLLDKLAYINGKEGEIENNLKKALDTSEEKIIFPDGKPSSSKETSHSIKMLSHLSNKIGFAAIVSEANFLDYGKDSWLPNLMHEIAADNDATDKKVNDLVRIMLKMQTLGWTTDKIFPSDLEKSPVFKDCPDDPKKKEALKELVGKVHTNFEAAQKKLQAANQAPMPHAEELKDALTILNNLKSKDNKKDVQEIKNNIKNTINTYTGKNQDVPLKELIQLQIKTAKAVNNDRNRHPTSVASRKVKHFLNQKTDREHRNELIENIEKETKQRESRNAEFSIGTALQAVSNGVSALYSAAAQHIPGLNYLIDKTQSAMQNIAETTKDVPVIGDFCKGIAKAADSLTNQEAPKREKTENEKKLGKHLQELKQKTNLIGKIKAIMAKDKAFTQWRQATKESKDPPSRAPP